MEKPTRWRGVPELEELFLDLAEVEKKNLASTTTRRCKKAFVKKATSSRKAHAVLKRMHKGSTPSWRGRGAAEGTVGQGGGGQDKGRR